MKVNPISSTNFSNLNNVNFSGRKKDNSQSNVTDVIRSKAAAVPVVVLLAANPATLNSAIPAQPLEGNRIEISQAQNDPEIDASTVDFQEVQQTKAPKYPYGWASLSKTYTIKGTIPIKTDRGDGVLILATYKKNEDKFPKDGEKRKLFSDVFLVLNDDKTPSGKPVTNPDIEPIRVIRLLHPGEEGNGSSYCVKTMVPNFKDINNPNELKDGKVGDKYIDLNFKLDDKSGKELDDALFLGSGTFVAVDEKYPNVLPRHVKTKEERALEGLAPGMIFGNLDLIF